MVVPIIVGVVGGASTSGSGSESGTDSGSGQDTLSGVYDRHERSFWWPLVDANHNPMWPLVGIVAVLPVLIFTCGKKSFYDQLREEARKLGADVAQPWFGIIGPRIGLELVAALEGRDHEEAKQAAAEAMETVTEAARVTAAATAAVNAANWAKNVNNRMEANVNG